ncbi:hypothetical protein LMG28138_05477 [Pararobbsia alpina]|uniref:Uncharacterized protein n=1 Tax=Pararobbsia alpina TaxID=621374 RepID=A0A6S7BL78_9BURK|nr:hypothetical protein LMG28138_05477 [Pararobbsia alpina]
MPNVRASSATTGTMRGPSDAPFSRLPSMRTIAVVVDISLPFDSSANWPQEDIAGTVGVCDAALRLLGR